MDKNTNRIAKNTFLLYIRSAIVLLISLYTSRVVLNALGVEDFGLYNVIGGVVALFSFMRTSLTKSTQRFLNAEMAKGNERLNECFVTSLNIHIVISILALILLETVGLWLLNAKIQIPPGRESASMIVYQTTVVSLVLTVLSTPYNAAIIAHEEMSYFAIVSIVNAVLKLLVAFLLLGYRHDSLVLYSYLMLMISVIDFIMYFIYCRSRYIETKFIKYFNKESTKEMLGYTTWTIVGQFAIVGTNQGNSILVNMFHSVTANAAMGVASQVNSALVTLTNSFQTAFHPQITKAYTIKDYSYLTKLINYTSKLSYIVLVIAALPIIFNIDIILRIWLGSVPQYSNVFCILMICNSILNALSTPLNFTALSAKDIKHFQITTSIVYLMDLPLVYFAFSLGFNPTAALVVKVIVMLAILFVRLLFCCRVVEGLSVRTFFFDVFLRLMLATAFAVSFWYALFSQTSGIWSRVLFTLISVVISCAIFYFIGMCKSERETVFHLLQTRIKHIVLNKKIC